MENWADKNGPVISKSTPNYYWKRAEWLINQGMRPIDAMLQAGKEEITETQRLLLAGFIRTEDIDPGSQNE
jgi:hypothetical protein